jgi:hypothetical protein
MLNAAIWSSMFFPSSSARFEFCCAGDGGVEEGLEMEPREETGIDAEAFDGSDMMLEGVGGSRSMS